MNGLSDLNDWSNTGLAAIGGYSPFEIALAIGTIIPVIWGVIAIWHVKSSKTAKKILLFWVFFDAFTIAPSALFAVNMLYYEHLNGWARDTVSVGELFLPGLILWTWLIHRLRQKAPETAASPTSDTPRVAPAAAPTSRTSAATMASTVRPAATAAASAPIAGAMTDREAVLAARVAELEALTATRASVPQGGNLVDQLWRYLTYFVPKPILAAGLAVFLVFHVWEFYNSGQKTQAETNLKQAEASMRDAEAVANALTVNGRPMRAETYMTELKKKQAEAVKAQRSAEAANAQAGNGLNTLEDELAANKAVLAELEALQEQLGAAITNAGTTGGYSAVARESVRVLCTSGYKKYFGCSN